MHQVLSYETAVRANSSREFREYVTKRTAVSLALTIAFITLITGYLLGNFVSERKYQIQKMMAKKNNLKTDVHHAFDPTSDDLVSLNHIQSYRKAKEKILASAQALYQKRKEDVTYQPSALNAIIFNKYISCTQEIPPNSTLESSQFIEQLIDNTAARQRECLRIIQIILDTNLEGT